MGVKVTIPNTGSDYLTFGSANTADAAKVGGYEDSTGNGHLELYTTASGTSTERMRIDSAGNVGIGTSSPAQKLSVVGTVESTSGGFKFPDGTTQTTAAASAYVGDKGQVFATTGTGQTFTIPTGVTAIKVTVVAGGAAGAGAVTNQAGGGGGAGGAAIKYLTGLTPGNTLTVAVGAAATASSVASGTQTISTISATAGSIGSVSTGGGAGGVGSGGNMNISGGGGGSGCISSTDFLGNGGAGGSSILGGGARAPYGTGNPAASNGVAAGLYGGGGSGGFRTGGTGTMTGGAGAQGVVIFEW